MDRYMGRSMRIRVMVNLQVVGCPRAVQYRPQLQYRMMQYKGELVFSLYCITFFSLSTASIVNWTVGVVRVELLLVPLPPIIVVGGPFLWFGLTMAASQILQIDK